MRAEPFDAIPIGEHERVRALRTGAGVSVDRVDRGRQILLRAWLGKRGVRLSLTPGEALRLAEDLSDAADLISSEWEAGR